MCGPGHKGHDDLTSSPPSSDLSPAVLPESPPSRVGNRQQGLRSLKNLISHFTARADDSHATPVWRLQAAARFHVHPSICQALVRFLMLHRLCGPPSIPLSFTLASILPRRCTHRVCFGTGVAPDTWCTSFTVRTTRVSKPVRSPHLRASASVHGQISAFATGVLPEIYRFHPSSRNSDIPSCTQDRQFPAHE